MSSARSAAEPDPVEFGSSSAAIAGTVRDPAGAPIHGAQVCAWIVDDERATEPQCSETNDDGSYRLAALVAGRFTLHASAAEFLPQQWTGRGIRLSAGELRERVDFVLEPGGVLLRGVVRDLAGGVVEGAWVVARASEFGPVDRSVARSNADGQFSVWTRPGRVDLGVEADGYARASRLTLAPGPTVEVFLIPESAIVGRVIAANDGAALEGVTITAREQRSRVAPARARSDASGRFRLDRLEPGVYELEARADELYGEAAELVHLGLVETVDEVVVELHPAFAVRGRVLVTSPDAERPCAAGLVRLTDRVDDRSAAVARVREGEVELRGVLPGRYEVTVRCEGAVAGREVPDLVLGEASETPAEQVWTVEQDPTISGVDDDEGHASAGVIAGLVRDDQGEPLANIAIHVTSGRSSAKRIALSDDQGQFRVEQVPPGSSQVLTFADGAALPGPGGDEAGVLAQVEPGETTRVELVVRRRDASVRGRVLEGDGSPVADAFVRHQLMAAAGWRSSDAAVLTDADGRFEIDGLFTATAYRVGAFRRGGGEAVVEGVEGGDVLTLTLIDTAELAGRVVGPDGSSPERFRVTVHHPSADFIRSAELFRSGGRFRMQELPPGEVVVLVESSAGVARVEGIDLDPGELRRDLVVALDPRVTVRGRVVDRRSRRGVPGMVITIGLQGTGVRFGTSTASELARTSDADGRFEVTAAPTGKVRVSVEPAASGSAHAWQWLELDVPATGDVVELGELEIDPAR